MRAGVDRMRRPKRAGEGELLVREIDGDDLPRPGELRAQHRAQAHAAETHHRNRRAGLDPRGVDDRADPRQHGAAEQGGQVERQLGVDPDAGFARDHRMGRESGNAEMVIDRLGAEGQPPLPPSSVPAPLALAPGSQSAGRPSAQGPQRPQLGTKTSTI